MVCGITIRKIPVEEFVFYITGFWFVIFLYVFGDEWFLKKYNQPDARYARYRSRLKRLVFVHYRSIGYAAIILILGLVIKRLVNPQGEVVPGYFFFLTIAAYTPAVVFYRVTRAFVNWRAFLFSMIITVLISIIWEVTLALPRGYWDYQHGAMLGLFIGVWHDLPLEAVTVWIFCTLVIFVYEFIKICYFTVVPSVPLHKQLLKFGTEWRRGKNGYLGTDNSGVNEQQRPNIEESEDADSFEIEEIKKNVTLATSLREGHRDARLNNGRFVE
jgi:hypothetical protein